MLNTPAPIRSSPKRMTTLLLARHQPTMVRKTALLLELSTRLTRRAAQRLLERAQPRDQPSAVIELRRRVHPVPGDAEGDPVRVGPPAFQRGLDVVTDDYAEEVDQLVID